MATNRAVRPAEQQASLEQFYAQVMGDENALLRNMVEVLEDFARRHRAAQQPAQPSQPGDGRPPVQGGH